MATVTIHKNDPAPGSQETPLSFNATSKLDIFFEPVAQILDSYSLKESSTRLVPEKNIILHVSGIQAQAAIDSNSFMSKLAKRTLNTIRSIGYNPEDFRQAGPIKFFRDMDNNKREILLADYKFLKEGNSYLSLLKEDSLVLKAIKELPTEDLDAGLLVSSVLLFRAQFLGMKIHYSSLEKEHSEKALCSFLDFYCNQVSSFIESKNPAQYQDDNKTIEQLCSMFFAQGIRKLGYPNFEKPIEILVSNSSRSANVEHRSISTLLKRLDNVFRLKDPA